jgi:cation diffusion facilitator CzcD-associated flavoprotein CzcO
LYPLNLSLAADIEPAAKAPHSPPPQAAEQPERFSRITPNGIQTSQQEHAFDLLIYATGFDGVTGAFDRIDIRGPHGVWLKEAWADGPRTYLGMLAEGFPNMLMVLGPHTRVVTSLRPSNTVWNGRQVCCGSCGSTTTPGLQPGPSM